MSTMNEPLLASPQPLPHSSSIHTSQTSYLPSITSSHASTTSLHTRTSRDTLLAPTTQPQSQSQPQPHPQPQPQSPPSQAAQRPGMAGKYGLYASESEYLDALRAWAEERKFVRVGEQGLVGFYGQKRMEEYAEEKGPDFHFIRRRRAGRGGAGNGGEGKGAQREGGGGDEVKGGGEVHGGGEVQGNIGRRASLMTGWMRRNRGAERRGSVR